jgi:UDP-N-acetylglucosamine acyltransferase
MGRVVIGARNRIFPNCVIGGEPQDVSYRGSPTRVEIGDDNTIREGVTINRASEKEEGVTTIGNGTFLMAACHVAHDCRIGDQCVLANNATLGGHVFLGDWVIMGGFSGIHQFCKVGAHAFIANNAAVTRDVPPYVMAVGQPASAHSVNAEGLKRRGFTPEQIRNLRNAFRLLYRSGLKLADASAQLAALAEEQPELRPVVEFLPQSTRSIVR